MVNSCVRSNRPMKINVLNVIDLFCYLFVCFHCDCPEITSLSISLSTSAVLNRDVYPSARSAGHPISICSPFYLSLTTGQVIACTKIDKDGATFCLRTHWHRSIVCFRLNFAVDKQLYAFSLCSSMIEPLLYFPSAIYISLVHHL